MLNSKKQEKNKNLTQHKKFENLEESVPELHDELWHHNFSFFKLPELNAVQLVCKKWNGHFNNLHFWATHNENYYPIILKKFKSSNFLLNILNDSCIDEDKQKTLTAIEQEKLLSKQLYKLEYSIKILRQKSGI